ncbi:MAG TPA: hypothetical protein VFL55_05685, partial [Acetobacteraceae bacterium]|nr:hypothetical protein [Acetobacteraceae bacterium]
VLLEAPVAAVRQGVVPPAVGVLLVVVPRVAVLAVRQPVVPPAVVPPVAVRRAAVPEAVRQRVVLLEAAVLPVALPEVAATVPAPAAAVPVPQGVGQLPAQPRRLLPAALGVAEARLAAASAAWVTAPRGRWISWVRSAPQSAALTNVP